MKKAHAVILVSWSFAFSVIEVLDLYANLQRLIGLGTTVRVGDSFGHDFSQVSTPYHRRTVKSRTVIESQL
jgi:hypothetical protein